MSVRSSPKVTIQFGIDHDRFMAGADAAGGQRAYIVGLMDAATCGQAGRGAARPPDARRPGADGQGGSEAGTTTSEATARRTTRWTMTDEKLRAGLEALISGMDPAFWVHKSLRTLLEADPGPATAPVAGPGQMPREGSARTSWG